MTKGNEYFEWFLTYGSAIIVGLVVVGALAYYGVIPLVKQEKFNPELHDCTERARCPELDFYYLYAESEDGGTCLYKTTNGIAYYLPNEGKIPDVEIHTKCVSWQPKKCFREVINMKWIDVCCIKLNQTLISDQSYDVNLKLVIEDDFDLLLQTRMRTNFSSEINVTLPNQLQFISPTICIDWLNLSEVTKVIIDESIINSERCENTPKSILTEVDCVETIPK